MARTTVKLEETISEEEFKRRVKDVIGVVEKISRDRPRITVWGAINDEHFEKYENELSKERNVSQMLYFLKRIGVYDADVSRMPLKDYITYLGKKL